jgi:hypothetical protein
MAEAYIFRERFGGNQFIWSVGPLRRHIALRCNPRYYNAERLEYWRISGERYGMLTAAILRNRTCSSCLNTYCLQHMYFHHLFDRLCSQLRLKLSYTLIGSKQLIKLTTDSGRAPLGLFQTPLFDLTLFRTLLLPSRRY